MFKLIVGISTPAKPVGETHVQSLQSPLQLSFDCLFFLTGLLSQQSFFCFFETPFISFLQQLLLQARACVVGVAVKQINNNKEKNMELRIFKKINLHKVNLYLSQNYSVLIATNFLSYWQQECNL